MSIAVSHVGPRPPQVPAPQDAPIHWPSAIVGLLLATGLVVGVSWLAAPRRAEPRTPVAAAPVAAAPVTEASGVEPPAAAPAPATPVVQAPMAMVERLRVAETRGAGVNLRASASERGARVKTLAEGTFLEVVGPDQRADGTTWRNVREPGGAVGWVSGSFVVKAERAP